MSRSGGNAIRYPAAIGGLKFPERHAQRARANSAEAVPRGSASAHARRSDGRFLPAQASPGSSGRKSEVLAPQTGQNQSLGMSSKAVPGGMPPSGSPIAGS